MKHFYIGHTHGSWHRTLLSRMLAVTVMTMLAVTVCAQKGLAVDEVFSRFGHERGSKMVEMNNTTLLRYDDGKKALDTTAVVPYTASESNLVMFRAMMRTRPYLTAQLSKSGLYGVGEQPGDGI